MHMLHMHISMDIIITALSFFITDFLLSLYLSAYPPWLVGMVTLSLPFVNPFFCIPSICRKRGDRLLPFSCSFAPTGTKRLKINLSKTVSKTTPP